MNLRINSHLRRFGQRFRRLFQHPGNPFDGLLTAGFALDHQTLGGNNFDFGNADESQHMLEPGRSEVNRIANLPDSSLIAKRLAPIRHLLSASPSYLEKFGTPTHPEDLQQHVCLAYSNLANSFAEPHSPDMA